MNHFERVLCLCSRNIFLLEVILLISDTVEIKSYQEELPRPIKMSALSTEICWTSGQFYVVCSMVRSKGNFFTKWRLMNESLERHFQPVITAIVNNLAVVLFVEKLKEKEKVPQSQLVLRWIQSFCFSNLTWCLN